MKALVVGARGFLGRELTAMLRRRGDDVHTLSSREPGGIDPETGLLPTDFAVAPGTDAVFYLAQYPESRPPPEQWPRVLEVNVVSAVRCAAAARYAGARRFLYTSTGNVYRPSFKPLSESAPRRWDNWYSLSKGQAEDALALFRKDLDVVCARLFTLYGPGQSGRLVPNLIDAVLGGREVTLEANPMEPSDRGGLRISLCHVYDAARILVELAQVGGVECINVASPRLASVKELAESIGAAAGISPQFRMLDTARQTDLVADVELLMRLFPATFIPLADGIRETVAATPGRRSAAY